MYYLDTSFAAALVLHEENSELAAAALQRVPSGEVWVSDWTEVEFASTVARLVRMRLLHPQAAARAVEQFEALVAASFELLLPTRPDFERARRYLAVPRTTLRGGDALHLAVAVNHGARAVLTFDRELIRAGRRLGVPVASAIPR